MPGRFTGRSAKSSPSTSRSSSPKPTPHTPARPPPPSQSGLLSTLGLAQPTLCVDVENLFYFLQPAPPDVPSADPILHGTVILTLPKARTLTHLKVRLITRFDISWPDSSRAYESGVLLDKTISLVNTAGEATKLEKGEHRFAFQFIIPSRAAVYERSIYGRCRMVVVATAKGLGAMGGDVTSPEIPVYFVVNPGGEGALNPPPPFEHTVQSLREEDLGPYWLSLAAKHIMVAGLFHLRAALLAPPVDLAIFSFKVKVNQIFALTSPSSPNAVVHPPVDTRTVLVLDATNPPNMSDVKEEPIANTGNNLTLEPLKIVRAGEEYKMTHFGRMSTDSVLRPTTHVWTDTPIRVQHEVVIEMVYRRLRPGELEHGIRQTEKDDKGREAYIDRNKLTTTRTMDVFSCNSFVDSLRLPEYTVLSPELEKDVPPCLCDYTFEPLYLNHGGKALRDEVDFVPSSRELPPKSTGATS